jgi:hypothetical protein
MGRTLSKRRSTEIEGTVCSRLRVNESVNTCPSRRYIVPDTAVTQDCGRPGSASEVGWGSEAQFALGRETDMAPDPSQTSFARRSATCAGSALGCWWIREERMDYTSSRSAHRRPMHRGIPVATDGFTICSVLCPPADTNHTPSAEWRYRTACRRGYTSHPSPYFTLGSNIVPIKMGMGRLEQRVPPQK